VSLRLRLAGHDAEVYVADSNLRYLAPVYEDLHAHAEAAEATGWDAFLNTFRQRRKARISIIATQPGATIERADIYQRRLLHLPPR
ncbi:YiiD C-terminal domain-containing protein, partial [Pseudomonas aeruginosa]|uniref:YiiD C-terminal domain-containing protein n=1 Tax=Pseudomonas aeruginosa TaxID=287 RepID=UPI0019691FD1